MGKNVENLSIVSHTQPGRGFNDYAFVAHYEDGNVDTPSPPFDQSHYDAIKAAAQQSQAAFDSAAASAVGSWYTNLAAPFKQAGCENASRM